MKTFFVFLIICLMSFPAIAQEAKSAPEIDPNLGGEFRGFVWGLPKTVILEEENGTFLDEKDGTLIYLDYIRGLKCTVMYEFMDDKLWRGRIFVERKFIDAQDYIETLLVIERDLTRRFGEPISQDLKWRDETEKNYPDKWGWAIYRSELFITEKWQGSRSDVTAFLGAPEKYYPQLSVTYESRAAKQAMALKKAPNIRIAP